MSQLDEIIRQLKRVDEENEEEEIRELAETVSQAIAEFQKTLERVKNGDH